jgi:hypothetical protein
VIDFKEVIFYAVISAIIPLIFRSVMSIKKNSAGDPLKDGYLMKPNLFYFVLGTICLLLPLVPIILTLIGIIDGFFPWGLIIPSFFFPFGYLFLKGYYTHRVFYNEEKVVVTNWFGQVKSMRWDEINSMTYSQLKGYFELKSIHSKLNVQPFMIGITIFIDKVKARENIDTSKLKMPF